MSPRIYSLTLSLSFSSVRRSRRGGGSSFGFGSSKRSASTSAPARRAPSQTPAPAAQSSGGGMMSGVMGNIAQGMMFGTGSAIGHRAVGAVAGAMSGDEPHPQETGGPMQGQQAQQMSTQACTLEKGNYFDCLKATQGDGQACSYLFQAMQSCQQNGAMGMQQGMGGGDQGGEKSWS